MVTFFFVQCQPETDSVLHEVLTSCTINMLLMYPFNARVSENEKNLLMTLKENIINTANAYNHAEAQEDIEK